MYAYRDVTEKSFFSFFNHNARQLKIKVFLANFVSIALVLSSFISNLLMTNLCLKDQYKPVAGGGLKENSYRNPGIIFLT